MIPAFSTAIARACHRGSARGRPPIGVIDGDGGVGDVGRIPGAAHAHLDDGRVDRGVGERRERHRRDELEEGQRVPAGLVDDRGVRLDLDVDLDEPLLDTGAPSMLIRSVIDSTCGLVIRPVRSPSPRSSASIIRDVEVLPLVPVSWTTG